MHCGVMVTGYNQGDWERLLAGDYSRPPAVSDAAIVVETRAAAVAEAGDLVMVFGAGTAQRIDADLQPLHRTLFCESNPIPVKWAVQRMGLIGPGIRLPLTPLAPQYHAAVLEAMTAASVQVAAA